MGTTGRIRASSVAVATVKSKACMDSQGELSKSNLLVTVRDQAKQQNPKTDSARPRTSSIKVANDKIKPWIILGPGLLHLYKIQRCMPVELLLTIQDKGWQRDKPLLQLESTLKRQNRQKLLLRWNEALLWVKEIWGRDLPGILKYLRMEWSRAGKTTVSLQLLHLATLLSYPLFQEDRTLELATELEVSQV